MHQQIAQYNQRLRPGHREIADLLALEIDRHLSGAECRLWHAHPVWFVDGNPTVGYSPQKAGLRLMFWSGADFDEPGLDVPGKRFKDASTFYRDVSQVDTGELRRWLEKSRQIRWDYWNIVRRKGVLVRLD